MWALLARHDLRLVMRRLGLVQPLRRAEELACGADDIRDQPLDCCVAYGKMSGCTTKREVTHDR